MSAMSDYLETAILNHIFRQTTFASPSAIYIALYTTSTDDNNTVAEITAAGYTRKQVTFNAPTVSGTSTIVTNAAGILFPVAEADWGTITNIGLFDAQSAGNLLYHGALATPKEILTGDILTFLEQDLTIGID